MVELHAAGTVRDGLLLRSCLSRRMGGVEPDRRRRSAVLGGSRDQIGRRRRGFGCDGVFTRRAVGADLPHGLPGSNGLALRQRSGMSPDGTH